MHDEDPRFTVAIFMTGFPAACQKSSPGPGGAMLSAAEQKEVLVFSEVEMDSLLKGWNADDYTVFSKDFNISGLWLEK